MPFASLSSSECSARLSRSSSCVVQDVFYETPDLIFLSLFVLYYNDSCPYRAGIQRVLMLYEDARRSCDAEDTGAGASRSHPLSRLMLPNTCCTCERIYQRC